MAKHLYSQTGKISRLHLRLDRVRIPIWLFSLAAITFVVAMSFNDMYASELERQVMAETMRNPAMIAMVGQGYGLDNYTVGAMLGHQMLLFTALTVAIMSILLLARHTRSEEEDGRIELIRSLPVGRLSNLSTAISIVCATNIVLALIIGFGLYALKIETIDLGGSLIYGAALGATGIFFTAVTAVFAQLSESSRGAIGFSFALLGFSYLLRAIGDVSGGTLSWFSPLGWILGSEVYVNNYWWPILLTVGVSILLIILAFYLNAIRDLESGFLPSRSGREHASRFLQSPLGLTLRLQRTGIIAWSIGMFILGASYGSVFGDLEAFFKDNEMLAAMLTSVEGFSLTEQFVTMLMSIMAMIAAIPTLMAMLKISGEEKKHRIEQLLGLAVSRTRLLGSSLFIAVVISFAMLSLSALGMWAASVPVMDEAIAFGAFYKAQIVYLPAMWIMIGITILLIGLLPKLTSVIWIYLIYSFIVVYLGGLLQLPEWLAQLTPFGQIPKLPIEDMDYMKTMVLTIIAIVFTIIGFIGYNKRDIK